MLFLGLLWVVLLFAYMGVFIRMLTFCGVIWWWAVLFLLGIVILVWLISDWMRAVSPMLFVRRKKDRLKEDPWELCIVIDKFIDKDFRGFLEIGNWDVRMNHIGRSNESNGIHVVYYIEFPTKTVMDMFLQDMRGAYKENDTWGILYQNKKGSYKK